MYDDCFFQDGQTTRKWLTENFPQFQQTKPFAGCPRATYYRELSDDVYMMAELEGNSVKDVHLMADSFCSPNRAGIFKISPFFKPDGSNLWHSSIDYGEGWRGLPFVVQNGWLEDFHSVFANGGCARMAFSGLGIRLECRNEQGILRMHKGNALEFERAQKGDPNLPYVDIAMYSLRALNSKDDDEYPALTEFFSVVENCETCNVAGVRCHRLLLWSGAADSEVGFSWTLLVPVYCIKNGHVPRVGDFVTGLAILYGTFLDRTRHRMPTVWQRPLKLNAGTDAAQTEDTQMEPEAAIVGEDDAEPQATKEEAEEASDEDEGFEYLPRDLESYPDACLAKKAAPFVGLRELPKYVSYGVYKKMLGDDNELVQQKDVSRSKLSALLKQIEVRVGENRRSPLLLMEGKIGVRHTAQNKRTGELHVWTSVPNPRRFDLQSTQLLIAVSPEGEALRYTLLNDASSLRGGKRPCVLNLDFAHVEKCALTSRALMSKFSEIKKDGYFVIENETKNEFFQAKCVCETPEREFLVEWQIFDLDWQFGIQHISEARLLKLLRIYWSKGLPGLEGEEQWEHVHLKE